MLLLGDASKLPALGKEYCKIEPHCHDQYSVRTQLGALLENEDMTNIRTAQDALTLLRKMMCADYAKGNMLVVDGWVLPKSLLLVNAYGA